jgi:hypothetical protein
VPIDLAARRRCVEQARNPLPHRAPQLPPPMQNKAAAPPAGGGSERRHDRHWRAAPSRPSLDALRRVWEDGGQPPHSRVRFVAERLWFDMRMQLSTPRLECGVAADPQCSTDAMAAWEAPVSSILLVLAAAAIAAPAAPGDETGVVRSLYTYVVATRPLGIPPEAEWRRIAPLFSRRIVGALDEARACEADYFRKHPARDEKPEFGWLERGLFSGWVEMAIPREFKIVARKSQSSGRWRVVVRLTYHETRETYHDRPPDPRNSFSWHVEVLMQTEDGRPVIDEIVHRAEATDESSWRLSGLFEGCSGRKWTGYRD